MLAISIILIIGGISDYCRKYMGNKEGHILIPGTYEYVTLHVKGLCRCNQITDLKARRYS